jgi:membrane protein insertase Oxa1/YidC/SpoIIIJ
LQAALGLYWMTSSAFQVFQQLYINKNIKKPLEDANTAIILDANKNPVAEVNINPESKNNKQQGNKNGNNRKKK